MIRTLIALITILSLSALSLPAKPLEVGAPAPQVTTIDDDGNVVAFADIYSKGITLVYFYPKAGTPGCTDEACSLRDSYAQLQAEGLQIIGVSRDSGDAQKSFIANNKLPFLMIPDGDGRVAEAFGVRMFSMKVYGLLPMQVAQRQSFLIKDGKIAWKSEHAQTKTSAAEVQKALDSLK